MNVSLAACWIASRVSKIVPSKSRITRSAIVLRSFMDLVSYDGGDAEDEGVYGLIWDKVSHGGGLFVNIQFQVQGPRLF